MSPGVVDPWKKIGGPGRGKAGVIGTIVVPVDVRIPNLAAHIAVLRLLGYILRIRSSTRFYGEQV